MSSSTFSSTSSTSPMTTASQCLSASWGMKLGCTPPMTTGTPRARKASASSYAVFCLKKRIVVRESGTGRQSADQQLGTIDGGPQRGEGQHRADEVGDRCV